MEPLAKLFGSPQRLKVLRLFLFNTDSAFTSAEIMERTKITKEAARQEVADLLSAGLIRKKGTQAPFRYQTDTRFEYLDALETFIRDTTSVQPKRITSALRKTGALQVIALTGLFTGALEPKVDLLIVGDHLDEKSIAKTIHALEAELGREIRYASFPTADFRYRLGVYDRLVRDIFDYPHRLLLDKIGL